MSARVVRGHTLKENYNSEGICDMPRRKHFKMQLFNRLKVKYAAVVDMRKGKLLYTIVSSQQSFHFFWTILIITANYNNNNVCNNVIGSTFENDKKLIANQKPLNFRYYCT